MDRKRKAGRLENLLGGIADVDSGISQRRTVRRCECLKALGIILGGPVAPHQFRTEIDAHFRDNRPSIGILCSGNLHGADKILLAISTCDTDRKLAPGKDDRFGKAVENVAQGRSAVGHGVSSVQDDKAVILVVPGLDQPRKLHPTGRLHIGRIDRRIEIVGIDFECKLLKFRNFIKNTGKIERTECLSDRVLLHTDRTTGVDEQNRGFDHGTSRSVCLETKKRESLAHRTATTSYPCCLPTLGEFRGSWSCTTFPDCKYITFR